MAWSIESRVPFLDYRLVEFTFGLPDEMKLDAGRTKVVLREALREILPEPIQNRRDKMGFVTPEALWMRGPGADWFREGAEQTLEAAPGVFEPDRLRREVEDLITGTAPFSFFPWRVLCLGRWLAEAERVSPPFAPADLIPAEQGSAPV